MSSKSKAVFGIYVDRAGVERAVETLKAAGLSNSDISALFPQNEGTHDFATEKHTKAPEGLRPEPERALCWAEVWDGWQELAR
jgi:hypothetical protein